MIHWMKSGLGPIYLPLFCYWKIWKARNDVIFRELKLDVHRVKTGVISILSDYLKAKKVRPLRKIGSALVVSSATGFFYGAVANGVGGAGAVLYISQTHYLHLKIGCGRRTNTRAELLTI